jgi:hypothetical protein
MSEPFQRPPRPRQKIGIGAVLQVHSLQSARGQELNGKRAVVVKRAGVQDRWEMQLEGEQVTTALKPDNLRFQKYPDKEQHPIYMDMVRFCTTQYAKRVDQRDRVYRSARGVTYDDDPPALRAQKLVELLDRPVGNYVPNQTMLMGVVLLYYGLVSEDSMRASCTLYDVEHISGLMSLAAMCQGEKMHAKGCGDGACEQVLFALLEAAPQSMDVLMEFLVSTPYIGPEEMYQGALRKSFQQARRDRRLTPNQMNNDYCNAMKGGIALICFLFVDAEPYKDILIRCLAQHSMFPLLLQRLILIVAREAMGLNDGKVLGRYARQILGDLANLSEHDFGKYQRLCDSEDGAGCFQKASLPAMLRAAADGSVTSMESLCDQLEEWME